MRAARSAWGVTMVNMLFPAGPLVLYVALPSVVLQGCTPASDAEEGDGSTCKDRDKCASYEWVLCEFSHIQEECPQKCRNCSDTADHDVPLMGDCGKNGPYCAVPSASCVVKSDRPALPTPCTASQSQSQCQCRLCVDDESTVCSANQTSWCTHLGRQAYMALYCCRFCEDSRAVANATMARR
eukprot:GEMP01029068.1.p1 GENE.GEMP01029068.1~~GEMP01029068.1.p1  ORF type:complete len:183 (+),score=36.14 GEMP01029068.1:195-743(+)